ncbi:MAG: DUF86 domain-containing protein [Candidatus Edwardsbacteria bacterium]|nr:DUF86 domain-containing protein [Candidatus Edwardsbacteria bacterium]
MKRECKGRLVKHLAFLEDELRDSIPLRAITWEEYRQDRGKRRNVERWIENLINSAVDIAKIVLAAENIPLPETYREMMASVALAPGFDKGNIERLAEWVRLRNVIAHEYLDIRWASIRRFLDSAPQEYDRFAEAAKEYLQRHLDETEQGKGFQR